MAGKQISVEVCNTKVPVFENEKQTTVQSPALGACRNIQAGHFAHHEGCHHQVINPGCLSVPWNQNGELVDGECLSPGILAVGAEALCGLPILFCRGERRRAGLAVHKSLPCWLS